jgi:hypothetical protein
MILNVQSEFPALPEYIIDELITNTVNDRMFFVVDQQPLNTIREAGYDGAAAASATSSTESGPSTSTTVVTLAQVQAPATRLTISVIRYPVGINSTRTTAEAVGKRGGYYGRCGC